MKLWELSYISRADREYHTIRQGTLQNCTYHNIEIDNKNKSVAEQLKELTKLEEFHQAEVVNVFTLNNTLCVESVIDDPQWLKDYTKMIETQAIFMGDK